MPERGRDGNQSSFDSAWVRQHFDDAHYAWASTEAHMEAAEILGGFSPGVGEAVAELSEIDVLIDLVAEYSSTSSAAFDELTIKLGSAIMECDPGDLQEGQAWYGLGEAQIPDTPEDYQEARDLYGQVVEIIAQKHGVTISEMSDYVAERSRIFEEIPRLQNLPSLNEEQT